jgi:tetracycline repressor-like protein
MSTATPASCLGPADPDPELSAVDLLASAAFRAAQRESAGEARPATGPAAAFRAARRRYLAGERIDMRALAAELAVSRATLYRWTGHREQLISDVAFSLSDDIFEQAKRETAHLAGADRLLAVFRRHVDALVGSAALQAFLRQETHAALRILTSRGGSVQTRTVARLTDLYREEARRGAFRPRADPGLLAYAVVRVTEGFIYNDALVAVEPAVEEAAAIVSLLLTA